MHRCTLARADEFQFDFLLLTSTLYFQLGSGSGLDIIKYPTCRNTCPLAAIQMPHSQQSYENWKDFFKKRLIDTGAFRLSDTFSKGDIDIEIYSALRQNFETTIQVGYFSSMTIIYVHIINPATPGKNRQQEIEHLYKYEFDEEKQYGPPGLDFNEINVQGISNLLDQGFNGSETIYYQNGKPVKSKLTTSYYPDSPQSTITYHFHRESILKRLLNKISGQHNGLEATKTINLRDIFNGLNGS